jgi:hypothetical protein
MLTREVVMADMPRALFGARLGALCRYLWGFVSPTRTTPAPHAPRYSAASSPAALHAALVEADLEIEALHRRLGVLHMDLEATTSCMMQLVAISDRYKLACVLGGVPVELMQKCLGDLEGGGHG